MSVFKPFTTSDVVISPFEVNKSFTFQGTSSFSLPNVNIDRFIGQNNTSSLWVSGSNQTGLITTQDKKLIYSSIKELYYSNYLQNPQGSTASTASFNNDGTITGLAYTPNYYNYLSSTLVQNRLFPTSSNSEIGIVSIPSNLFGEYLKPNTFSLECTYGTITDDSNGNLLLSSSTYFTSSYHVGNIIYEHGMVIINEKTLRDLGGYGFVSYGIPSPPEPVGIYGGLFGTLFETDNITCSFESTVTIHESQYKCTLRQNEFNFSQNPSIISGSSTDSAIYNFATGSYFTPYVTTVGMYNNANELIAVAKLAQPLPISQVTDTSILVNLDL